MLILLAFPVAGAGLSGQIKSSTDSYSEDLGEPTDPLTPYYHLELSAKHRFSKRLRLQWRLTALGNFEAEAKGGTEELPFTEQVFADLPEAYVERKWGSNKLRFGMNTVNWGVVDGYSPSSVVNTSAYFHPLRMPKRGSPMVEIQTGREALSLHALYIPRQPRAILPATDSRWLPRDLLVNFGSFARVQLPDRIDYRYGSEIELDGDGDKARDNNYGARLHSHLGSWDFQLTHFDGASPFPKIRPTALLVCTADPCVAQPDVRLDPVSYRARTSGAGVTYAGEKWIYRFEGAYTHVESSGYGLQPWSWTGAAGVETNVEIGASTLTVLAQWYHSEFPTKADNQISSSYRLFDRTGVLGLRWPASDTWTFNGTALVETVNHGLFWTAGFEQKIKDALRWGLGWRDFSARDNGLIKTFDRNDHFALDLTYFF